MFQELSQLPRKELQLLAKSYGLKANAANSVLIQQIMDIRTNTDNEEPNGGDSKRSSTSTVDTIDQFPGLIKSVKAELECKLLIESNKVPLRKSMGPEQINPLLSPSVEASGKWAVSWQKCIGEMVKSNSFVALSNKFHSATKQPNETSTAPFKPISPIKSHSSSIPVLSGKKRVLSETESSSTSHPTSSPTKVITASVSPSKKAPDFARLHSLQFSASRSITDCVRKTPKSGLAVGETKPEVVVQASKRPKLAVTAARSQPKPIPSSVKSSSFSRTGPISSTRATSSSSPTKPVIITKPLSSLRTPHNRVSVTGAAASQSTRLPALNHHPRTDASAASASTQFKARPMPNFKALHGTKPSIVLRTVHTPTVPTATSTTAATHGSAKTGFGFKAPQPASSASSRVGHVGSKFSANKENVKQTNNTSATSRPITIRKDIDLDQQRMARKVDYRAHSHNETGKSLSAARGITAPMKRLVPVNKAAVTSSSSDNKNVFDGFSGDGEF